MMLRQMNGSTNNGIHSLSVCCFYSKPFIYKFSFGSLFVICRCFEAYFFMYACVCVYACVNTIKLWLRGKDIGNECDMKKEKCMQNVLKVKLQQFFVLCFILNKLFK